MVDQINVILTSYGRSFSDQIDLFEQNKMNERKDGSVGLEPSGGTLGRKDLK